MTTTIADSLFDGGLSADGKATVRFTPATVRDASDSSGIIGRKTIPATIDQTTGAFTVDLDPGTYDVRVKTGAPGEKPLEGRIVVPDSATDIRLWPLLEAYVPPAAATVYGVTLDAVTDAAIASNVSSGDSDTRAALDATYGRLELLADGITYNSDGTVATSTEGGITTTYTWNADGTCATETRLGLVKTWTYDASGNPISSTVTEV